MYRNQAIEGYNFPYITELAGKDAVKLIPLDVDEDGRMDILVQRQREVDTLDKDGKPTKE